jgi:Leucine-rich repeat (LRR) protein
MKLSRKTMRRLSRVAHADSTSFVALVRLSELDPRQDFEGANLEHVDFGTDDLTGYNFRRASLRFSNLANARGLQSVNLDEADLTGARIAPPQDYSINQIKRMVVTRTTIPPLWVHFTTELRFYFSDGLHDLGGISDLTQLRRLYLNGTMVADLAPLSRLSRLEVLDVDNSRVMELAPLASLLRGRTNLGPLKLCWKGRIFSISTTLDLQNAERSVDNA